MKNHFKNAYDLALGVLLNLLYLALKWAPVRYYQPLYGAETQQTTRACEDRWVVISKYMDDKAGAILDIGCNLGYFTFKASEKGKMAMGVDTDPFYIIACNTVKSVKEMRDSFFLRAFVTKSFLQKMPFYDTVFNFSVFHHWVKAYGKDEAIEMMKILSLKTQTLFFETGQPDEIGTKWAERLSFMGDKPDEWGISFLKECGFTSVEVIGTFSTGLTSTDRYLFFASK